MFSLPHLTLTLTPYTHTTSSAGAELYISGESYAGFYIPWIASHIVRSQLVPDSRGNLVRDVAVGELCCVFAWCVYVNCVFLFVWLCEVSEVNRILLHNCCSIFCCSNNCTDHLHVQTTST